MLGTSAAIAVLEVSDLKIRILAAVVLLPLLLIILILLPPLFTGILLSVMCAIAAYELLWGTKLVRNPRLVAYTVIAAAVTGIWCSFGSPYGWGLAGGLAFCCLLWGEMLLAKTKLHFEKVLVCVAGGLLIPYLLCAIVRIRNMELGAVYVLLPFVLSFISDSGAYFAGMFLGKHKLAPNISPKKTVEGLFGGVAAAILGVILYGLVLSFGFDRRVNYLICIVYGILGSLASVLGDLTFSVIKRQSGIKDYGNLIPGHGGVLDRFDSMTVVAPLTEVLLILLPIAEKING